MRRERPHTHGERGDHHRHEEALRWQWPRPPNVHSALPARRRRIYVPRRGRVVATMALGLAWASLSVAIDRPWVADLSAPHLAAARARARRGHRDPPRLSERPAPGERAARPAETAPGGSSGRAGSDRPRRGLQRGGGHRGRRSPRSWPRTTPDRCGVLVIDDGSTDGTRGAVARVAALGRAGRACGRPTTAARRPRSTSAWHAPRRRSSRQWMPTRCSFRPRCGASSRGSWSIRTGPSPWRARSSSGTAAAGWSARMQEWDYQLGITAVKRQQALLGATLVAQGAFSVYRTRAMRLAGGWPDRIGEDIVATWSPHRARRPGGVRADGGRVHDGSHQPAPLHHPAAALGARHDRGPEHARRVAPSPPRPVGALRRRKRHLPVPRPHLHPRCPRR